MKRDFSLKGKKLFREIFRQGKRYRGTNITLLVLKNSEAGDNTSLNRDIIKIGFSINKKFGNAVMRNKAKKKARAVFRELIPRMKQDVIVVLRIYPGLLDMPHERISLEIERVCRKAGLLNHELS